MLLSLLILSFMIYVSDNALCDLYFQLCFVIYVCEWVFVFIGRSGYFVGFWIDYVVVKGFVICVWWVFLRFVSSILGKL